MEATPTVPSRRIPLSQQEAQGTVLRLLQDTANILPTGTTLDGSRYPIGRMDKYCEDDPAGPESPVHVEDWRDLKLPFGTDFDQVIAATGDTWTQWGWHVIERDGFEMPNRFGYTPEGYVLHLEARTDAGAAPLLIGTSPCYPGDLRTDIPRNPPLIPQN
ncbi:hypothetical protein MN2019_24290 [Mycolicibacterium neoaurum]|uniref:hypothetical protein n=1 Tax=Mycolicibacterium neoaurum TaxID=1795 RepID=UPI001BCFC131|nr:hypothetical protein [Mycolicibacterium neoaurum]QVI27289.1 hypothetical protein MN2019_24290 [Mycolicibacterium neoaurum]